MTNRATKRKPGRPPGAPNKARGPKTRCYDIRLTEAQHAHARDKSGCGSAAAWIRAMIDRDLKPSIETLRQPCKGWLK